jgi:hypothetical protein
MRRITLVLSIIVVFFVLISCNKDAKTFPVQVRMTDVTGPYDAANIDLQAVEITGNDGEDEMINVHEGIYNQLDFVANKSIVVL